MTAVFMKVLNTGIIASFVILAVIALRLIFRGAPKRFICALWAIVALRLLIPFSIPSPTSLIPFETPVTVEEQGGIDLPDNASYEASDESVVTAPVAEPEYVNNNDVTPVLNYDVENNAERPVINRVSRTVVATYDGIVLTGESGRTASRVLTAVWGTGALLILGYEVVTYIITKRRLATSTLVDGSLYQSDRVSTPIVFGLVKARIYVPYGLDGEVMRYVVDHEKSHIARFDHVVKPLAFALLAVYWFNPLVWLSYILLCRDIELACDERVVSSYNADDRKAYAGALLYISGGRAHLNSVVCPLAFGRVKIKERIIRVIKYKKASRFITVTLAVMCVVACAAFMTGPIAAKINISTEDQVLESLCSAEGDAIVGKPKFVIENGVIRAEMKMTIEVIEEFPDYTDPVDTEGAAEPEKSPGDAVQKSAIPAAKAASTGAMKAEMPEDYTPETMETAETDDVSETVYETFEVVQANYSYNENGKVYEIVPDYFYNNGITSSGNSFIDGHMNEIMSSYIASFGAVPDGADPATVILRSYDEYCKFKDGLPEYEQNEWGSEGTSIRRKYYLALPEYESSYFDKNILVITLTGYAGKNSVIGMNGDLIEIGNYKEWSPNMVTDCAVHHSISYIGLDCAEYGGGVGVKFNVYNKYYNDYSSLNFKKTWLSASELWIDHAYDEVHDYIDRYCANVKSTASNNSSVKVDITQDTCVIFFDDYMSFLNFYDMMPESAKGASGKDGFNFPYLFKSFFDEKMLVVIYKYSDLANPVYELSGMLIKNGVATFYIDDIRPEVGVFSNEGTVLLAALDRNYAEDVSAASVKWNIVNK